MAKQHIYTHVFGDAHGDADGGSSCGYAARVVDARSYDAIAAELGARVAYLLAP